MEIKTITLRELTDKYGKIRRSVYVGQSPTGEYIYEDKEYTADELSAETDLDKLYQACEDDRVYYSSSYQSAIYLGEKGLTWVQVNGDFIQGLAIPEKDLFIFAGHDGFDVYNLAKK